MGCASLGSVKRDKNADARHRLHQARRATHSENAHLQERTTTTCTTTHDSLARADTCTVTDRRQRRRRARTTTMAAAATAAAEATTTATADAAATTTTTQPRTGVAGRCGALVATVTMNGFPLGAILRIHSMDLFAGRQTHDGRRTPHDARRKAQQRGELQAVSRDRSAPWRAHPPSGRHTRVWFVIHASHRPHADHDTAHAEEGSGGRRQEWYTTTHR